MRERESGKNYKKTGRGRMRTAGHFSVIVDPYVWKQLTKANEKKYIREFGIKSWHFFFLARLIYHEETWKYKNGSRW